MRREILYIEIAIIRSHIVRYAWLSSVVQFLTLYCAVQVLLFKSSSVLYVVYLTGCPASDEK